MTQAVGVLLVLLGTLLWHIASADQPHHNISDIWQDLLSSSKQVMK